MAASLSLIILLGLLSNGLFTKLKLPGFLGMLILGVLIGPYCFNLLNQNILNLSTDFRKIALIIILLRAGFSIHRESLNKVGATALKISFIPSLLEGFTIAFVAIYFLDFTFIQGGILGFIIAPVSPAVVIPQMLAFTESKLGTNKSIPTLILAGASLDDVIAITIFTTFMGIYSSSHLNIGLQLLNIPISIFLGILIGLIIGLFFTYLFKKFHIRDTKKVLMILGTAIFFSSLETALKGKVEIASLLGIMTIGFVILEKMPHVAARLSTKFNKIWLFAELLLFVLVGAQVNIPVALNAGFIGLGILFIGLVARSIGVLISTIGSPLNWKERLFTILAYVPKASVQAAIGALPLSAGVASGDVMLALAVLSIVVTAPLGAIAIKATSKRLLTQE